MQTPPKTLIRAMSAALLISAPLLSGGAAAQTPLGTPAQRNDLLAIYRLALSNDPVFAAARFARQASQEREPQARAATLPNVNASLGYNITNFDSKTPDFNRTFNAWGPAIQATVPIYRPQNWNALDQAKLQVQSADLTFAQAQQDLILRVALAYFDVLGAQDDLTAIEASKKAVSEQLAQARREFEVGTKTIVDTHEAQARFDQIVAQEQVVRGTLIVRQNALRSIIGQDAGTLVPLADRPQLKAPQPLDVDSWARQAEEGAYPVQIAAQASRLGDRLTIAGFGMEGRYLEQTGVVTEYLSPSPAHPKEFVECRATARNGDSGGPMFNAAGELAGVLFGEARGLTAGSCSTRLRLFLAAVPAAPGSAPQLAAARCSCPGGRCQHR
jgi:outer membrane protein TolC